MTKVNPNNGKETKSDIIFSGLKELEYFNDVSNWHF